MDENPEMGDNSVCFVLMATSFCALILGKLRHKAGHLQDHQDSYWDSGGSEKKDKTAANKRLQFLQQAKITACTNLKTEQKKENISC